MLIYSLQCFISTLRNCVLVKDYVQVCLMFYELFSFSVNFTQDTASRVRSGRREKARSIETVFSDKWVEYIKFHIEKCPITSLTKFCPESFA